MYLQQRSSGRSNPCVLFAASARNPAMHAFAVVSAETERRPSSCSSGAPTPSGSLREFARTNLSSPSGFALSRSSSTPKSRPVAGLAACGRNSLGRRAERSRGGTENTEVVRIRDRCHATTAHAEHGDSRPYGDDRERHPGRRRPPRLGMGSLPRFLGLRHRRDRSEPSIAQMIDWETTLLADYLSNGSPVAPSGRPDIRSSWTVHLRDGGR